MSPSWDNDNDSLPFAKNTYFKSNVRDENDRVYQPMAGNGNSKGCENGQGNLPILLGPFSAKVV